MRGTFVTPIHGSLIHKYVHDGRPPQSDEQISCALIIYLSSAMAYRAAGSRSRISAGTRG